MNSLGCGSDALEILAQSDAAIETEVDPFVFLTLQLNVITNTGINTHSKIVTKPTFQLFQTSMHLPFVSNLDDFSIFVGGDSGMPHIEPRFLCFEPFEQSGLQLIKMPMREGDWGAAPAQASGKIIACSYGNDAEEHFCHVHTCLARQRHHPKHSPIPTTNHSHHLPPSSLLHPILSLQHTLQSLLPILLVEEINAMYDDRRGFSILIGQFSMRKSEVFASESASTFAVDEEKERDFFLLWLWVVHQLNNYINQENSVSLIMRSLLLMSRKRFLRVVALTLPQLPHERPLYTNVSTLTVKGMISFGLVLVILGLKLITLPLKSVVKSIWFSLLFLYESTFSERSSYRNARIASSSFTFRFLS